MPIDPMTADQADFDVVTLGEVMVLAGGLIFGLLDRHTPDEAVTLGTAHGALLQTTRGDTSQVSLSELEHVAAGGSARIKR